MSSKEYVNGDVLKDENNLMIYENYNKLQKSQGYDLSLFKGVTVTQYTYEVKNYPTDEVVLVHLLVYDGVIIGADVMSTAADGFMQGLK